MTISTDAATSSEGSTFTIGAVCDLLRHEFEDISISKIRFLEDQGLLTPRRSPGGYRLYGEAELERLRAILRLQRDQYMPLRVIRDELLSGRQVAAERPRARPPHPDRRLTRPELLAESGAEYVLLADLEDYGIVAKRDSNADYSNTELEVVAIARRLATYGLDGRHLRSVQATAQRASALIEGIVGPSLRARATDRREHGERQLEELTRLIGDLVERLIALDVDAIGSSG